MSWVRQWREYIYYDLVTGESNEFPKEEPETPGPLNWDAIAKPLSKKRYLLQSATINPWYNIQLATNLREHVDIMLTTPEMFDYIQQTYGIRGRPVIRYGIEQPDGECCVELYLHSLTVFPVPSSVFGISEPLQFVTSRMASLDQLKSQLLIALNTAAADNGNKSSVFTSAKLWKFAESVDFKSLEKKASKNSKVEVEG